MKKFINLSQLTVAATNLPAGLDILMIDTDTGALSIINSDNEGAKADITHSAFEVMPNKVEITDNVSVPVPACTTHKFILRSATPAKINDVIIDWGDGTIEKINDGKHIFEDNKNYVLEHDYAASMKKDIEKFIVKIYGKDYYTFRSNDYADNNLISRIFDIDLPIADHIANFASMCYGAKRLTKVKIPHSTKYITTAFNFASTFEKCINLIEVKGFEDSPLKADCIISNIFRDCANLTTTDFQIPKLTTSIAGIFLNCAKLDNPVYTSGNIIGILPQTGLLCIVNAAQAFEGCTLIADKIPTSWNAKDWTV